MFHQTPTISVFVLAALTGLNDAYWRMSCSNLQTGRIDPVVSPGQIASHVHKIAGGSSSCPATSSNVSPPVTAPCHSMEHHFDRPFILLEAS